MYCISQIDETSTEKIIKVLDSPISFLEYIIDSMKDRYNVKLMEGLNSDHIKNNICFPENYYLIKNGDQLIQKFKKISHGYIHNTVQLETKTLYTWKLLPLYDKGVCNQAKNSEQKSYVIHPLPEKSQNLINYDIKEEMENQEYQEFDFSKMEKYPKIAIVGGKELNKHLLIQKIINQLNRNDICIEKSLIISPTEKAFYEECFPDAEIIFSYNPQKIQEHLDQENGCIILDNCFHQNDEWMDEESTYNLFYNGRTFHTPFIVVMHDPIRIKPELRCQFDYIFVFEENDYFHTKKLYQYYGSMFSHFESFNRALSHLTTNDKLMVITQKNYKSIIERIFYYDLQNKENYIEEMSIPDYLNIEYQKFNPHSMNKHSLISIVGKRGSGKSWLARELIIELNQEHDFYKESLIISPMDKITPFYKNYFPEATILYEFDLEKIKEHVDNNKNGCIVLDDCLDVREDAVIKNLVHYCYLNDYPLILTMQHSFLKPDLRAYFDYLFFFSENAFYYQKRLYSHYGGLFPSQESFQNALTHLTKDYQTMVIINKSNKNNITDRVFFYKANDVPFSKINGMCLFDDQESSFYEKEFYKAISQNMNQKLDHMNINENTKHLILHHFDLNKMISYPLITIYGPRHSGKTHLIKEILDKLNNNPTFLKNTLIIAPMDRLCMFYHQNYPEARISYDFNSNLIKEYMYKENGCIVIDDYLFISGTINDLNLLNLIYNNKLFKVPVILAMQAPLSLSQEIRSYIDYVFIFKNQYDMEKLHEQYGDIFPTYKLFKEINELVCMDYDCLVIANKNRKLLHDKIYWYQSNDY
jgi:uridine kinase